MNKISVVMKWQIILIVLLVAVIVVYANVIEDPFLAATSPPKQVIENSLDLRELWRWSGYVCRQKKPPLLLIKDDKIIVGSAESRRNKVIAFEAQSGEMIWESVPTFENIQSLTVNDEAVYAGYLKYVQAYDLESGELLWKAVPKSKYGKGAFYVYTRGEQLDVYDASSNWPLDEGLFVLDSKTGQTIDTIEWSRIFFYRGDIFYSRVGPTETGFYLVAQDRATKDELWRLEKISYPRRWPVVVDNTMYLEAGDIYALNPETGEIYWQSEAARVDRVTGQYYAFPGNSGVPTITQDAGLIYTIRYDEAIIGLDAQTGQEVGIIEVDPLPVYQDERGSAIDTCNLIAASDRIVAVYYHDSRELIVFEREEVSNADQ